MLVTSYSSLIVHFLPKIKFHPFFMLLYTQEQINTWFYYYYYFFLSLYGIISIYPFKMRSFLKRPLRDCHSSLSFLIVDLSFVAHPNNEICMLLFLFSPFNFRNILIIFMSQKLYKYSKFDMRKILNLFFGKIWGQSVRLKCWKTISKSNLKVGLEV